MRVLIQRVKHASCTVDEAITGKIEKGFLLFIGFTEGDNEAIIDKVLYKVSGLRIFEDENGKMNKALKDVNGSILAISQFTLYADYKKGFRPSFTAALGYEAANSYYELTLKKLKDMGFNVEKGIFGADMKIDLLNDGPVTIMIDSNEL